MSRFSPDTWTDAIQLPLAMVQFKGNVYVEPIAPDIRPVVFLLTLIILVFIGAARWFRRLSYFSHSVYRCQILGLISATFLSLFAWIFTSANGRYGILVLTLCPFAIFGGLIIFFESKVKILAFIYVLVFFQLVILCSSDPDDTWSKLTVFRWDEKYADRLSEDVVKPFREISEKENTLIVTTKTLTGMTTLYQVFGPDAYYMNLAHIDQHKNESVEFSSSIRRINSSEKIYLSKAVPQFEKASQAVEKIKSAITTADRNMLLRFGLSSARDEECYLMPPRMGAQLQICPLRKVSSKHVDPWSQIPKEKFLILKKMEKACPSAFSDFRLPITNDGGDLFTNVHDGKYFITIADDLSIYVRHRSELEARLILSGKSIESLGDFTCSQLTQGWQYWR